MIHKEQNCSKEIVTGLPDVDFRSCYSKVEIEYGITEGLIIVIVLDKKALNNLTTYYSFYNPKTGFNQMLKKYVKMKLLLLLKI